MTSQGAWVTAQARWTSETTRLDAPILLDAAALVAFPIVRTIGDTTLIAAWAVAVFVLAIRWPGSGLGLAAAIMVFPQSGEIGVPPSVGVIAAASIGYTVNLVLQGESEGPMRRWLAVVVAGVIALGAATMVALFRTIRRFGPEASEIAARRWLEFGVGFLLLVLLLWVFSKGSIRPLVLGLIGISVAIALSLVEWLFPTFLPSLGGAWLSTGPESTRAAGPFITPNRLGAVAGIMVIIATYQALMAERWRWLWGGLTVLSGIALVATFSRGPLLGLFVAVAAMVATRSRRAAAVLLVGAVILGVLALPVLIAARLGGGTIEEQLSNDAGRLDAWLAGIRMILAEPIFGHGFHSFRAIGEDYGATDGLLTAHNEFIGLWAENGIAAIAAYLAILAGVVGCVVARRTDPWAIAVLGALTLFVVAGLFVDTLNYLGVTGPLWLVVAYGIARPMRARDAADREPAPNPGQ